MHDRPSAHGRASPDVVVVRAPKRAKEVRESKRILSVRFGLLYNCGKLDLLEKKKITAMKEPVARKGCDKTRF